MMQSSKSPPTVELCARPHRPCSQGKGVCVTSMTLEGSCFVDKNIAQRGKVAAPGHTHIRATRLPARGPS